MSKKAVIAIGKTGVMFFAPSINVMSIKTGVSYGTIVSRISDGKRSNGLCFDYAMEGVDYENSGKSVQRLA